MRPSGGGELLFFLIYLDINIIQSTFAMQKMRGGYMII